MLGETCQIESFMPFDPRSNRPSRHYTATPRDTTSAALFWALVVIAALGIWIVAGSLDAFSGGKPVAPEQTRIVVPDNDTD